MKDFLTDGGGSSRVKISNLDHDNLAVWTTIRINKLFEDVENGVVDISVPVFFVKDNYFI